MRTVLCLRLLVQINKIGKDNLIVDEKVEIKISFEDYALALLYVVAIQHFLVKDLPLNTNF